VAFFKLDTDKHVARGCQSEDEMRNRHYRRGPERNQEAEVDRVSHQPIKERGLECQCRWFAISQRGIYLAQAEQIEVIDEKGRHQYDAPAEKRQGDERQSRRLALYMPQRSTDGLPENEQKNQGERCREHIRAALECARNQPCPDALEAPTRHAAVLDCKNRQQHRVQDERLPPRPACAAAIQAFGHELEATEVERKIADEADGVKKCQQKQDVNDNAICKKPDSFQHGFVLRCGGAQNIGALGPAARYIPLNTLE